MQKKGRMGQNLISVWSSLLQSQPHGIRCGLSFKSLTRRRYKITSDWTFRGVLHRVGRCGFVVTFNFTSASSSRFCFRHSSVSTETECVKAGCIPNPWTVVFRKQHPPNVSISNPYCAVAETSNERFLKAVWTAPAALFITGCSFHGHLFSQYKNTTEPNHDKRRTHHQYVRTYTAQQREHTRVEYAIYQLSYV